MAAKKHVIFRRALIGAGLTALAVGVSTALAGSGVGGVFNLGEVNTVNAQTTLSGNAGGNPQLRVENSATVQNAFGVLGRITAGAPAAQTAGVRGINSGTNANGFGVWGFHQGSGVGVFGETAAGIGVLGKHTSATGTNPGIRGETSSAAEGAVGVFGTVTAATPGTDSAGVLGTGGRAGLLGEGSQTGGSFFSPGTGVYACAEPPAAAFPCSRAPFDAVSVGGQFRGVGSDGIGVLSCAGTLPCSVAPGVPYGGMLNANGNLATGVMASASGGPNAHGVRGSASGPGAVGGRFVSYGLGSSDTVAVLGETEEGVGGQFRGSSLGLLAQSSSGAAGRFEGDVHVTGKLTRAYTVGTSSQATPVAYGAINGDGTLVAGTPNVTSTFDSANTRYVITIAGENYSVNTHITDVTVRVFTSTPKLAETTSSGGKLLVRFKNLSNTVVQSSFSFVTYKP